MPDAYIRTLKEDNQDITYPQTKASAVFTNSGSDVETQLAKCARFVEDANVGDTSFTETLTNIIYPTGSILKTTDSTYDPNNSLSGTWTLIATEKDRHYICSQPMWTNDISRGSEGKTTVIGSYGTQTLDWVFRHADECPENYHREWMLSALVSTTAGFGVYAFLNNISTDYQGTYSGQTFRYEVNSRYFTLDEVVLEPTLNYTGTNGINIGMYSGGATGYCYNITLHGYYVSDDIYYKWRRDT